MIKIPKNIDIYFMLFMTLTLPILYYILIIYPKNKKINKQNKIITNLTKNNEIITYSGIIGVIEKILNEKYILLLIDNNTKIILNIKFIKNIIPKGTFNNLKKKQP